MKRFAIYQRSIITISFIVITVFVLTRCINKQEKEKEGDRPVSSSSEMKNFAGSATCASCHKDIYEKHLNTAHFKTSMSATEESIKGSFAKGQNIFAYSPQVAIMMEKRKDGFYQVEYVGGEEKKNKRMDIVIGSATKGQTYISWTKDRMFQMPITYFTPAHQWSNSPGFPNRVVFNRPITSRCLECHTTYVHKLSDEKAKAEEFDSKAIIYGVDCERCHGPSAQHVAFQTANPTDTTAHFVINPAKLSRQQHLDLCILCHGGRLSKSQPSFSFKAGDKLSEYFHIDTVTKSPFGMDVHGNQYGLLSASKCFLQSQMTCSSCHNTHENEKDRIELYSQRCMNCHTTGHEKTCKMTSTIGKAITKNCIDCHMPKEPSMSVAVQLQGETVPTPALLRTHYIKVYPDETKKVLTSINLSSK